MRALLHAVLVLVAPAAIAWPSCDEPGLASPVATQREAPAYPPPVRDIGVEGSVKVAFTVLRDGRVGWAQVLQADPPGYFEQAALAGVRNWRFAAARANGEPVECRMQSLLRFTLVDAVDSPHGTAGNAERPGPVYPASLLAGRVEGYVEVQFEVESDGRVANARVITAMPRGEFEAATLAAIRGWRFPSEAGDTRQVTRRFEFRLPDSTLTDVPPIMLASAPFPMLACRQRINGRVQLEVETDAAGMIRKARVLSSEPKGLFDPSALAIARASRLTPAYHDGQPVAATALLTLFFDPNHLSCPGSLSPTPQRAPRNSPPNVSGRRESPAHNTGPGAALSWTVGQ